MRIVRIIAQNTYQEIIRDRILYGLVIFALILIGMSLALGQLSFAEQSRISVNFGFSSIHLSAVVLAIFLGSSLVAKEIDKKTIMTLLVRPITRLEFLMGKCLGLVMVIFTLISGLAIVLALVCLGLGLWPNMSFVYGLYGVLLESLLLLGVTLFFSSFSRPIMVVIFSIGIFLIGHWLDSLAFFAGRSDSELFSTGSQIIIKLFPNLELFNWRSFFIYGDIVPVGRVLSASLYSVSWFFLTVTMAAAVIRRRDFG